MPCQRAFLAICLALVLGACSDQSPNDMQTNESVGIAGGARGQNSLLPANTEILNLRPPANPERNAYFGDLHVHTRYSFDAYIFGTRADPDDAYEFARGAALSHPAGFEMQLDTPLDFYGVSDHGAYLGI